MNKQSKDMLSTAADTLRNLAEMHPGVIGVSGCNTRNPEEAQLRQSRPEPAARIAQSGWRRFVQALRILIRSLTARTVGERE